MVKFEFTKDLGPDKKGDVKVMHKSTAAALVAHKFGKIVGKVKFTPEAEKPVSSSERK